MVYKKIKKWSSQCTTTVLKWKGEWCLYNMSLHPYEKKKTHSSVYAAICLVIQQILRIYPVSGSVLRAGETTMNKMNVFLAFMEHNMRKTAAMITKQNNYFEIGKLLQMRKSAVNKPIADDATVGRGIMEGLWNIGEIWRSTLCRGEGRYSIPNTMP